MLSATPHASALAISSDSRSPPLVLPVFTSGPDANLTAAREAERRREDFSNRKRVYIYIYTYTNARRTPQQHVDFSFVTHSVQNKCIIGPPRKTYARHLLASVAFALRTRLRRRGKSR